MIAEVIAVGSELLRYGKRDTNSEWLIRRLHEAGLEVGARSTTDDDAGRLAAFIRGGLERADVVVLTGGLGPTGDDRTREALARALDVPLEQDDSRAELLRRLYERYGRRFGGIEARQAARPATARWIDNPLGSAPGLLVDRDGGLVAALPGVPSEMRAMFEAGVLPRLRALATGTIGQRTLRTAGRTESSLEGAIRDLYTMPGVDLTILGGPDGVELHARASGKDSAEVAARLDAFELRARDLLGSDVFGTDRDRLAAVTGALLIRRGKTLASAESCTAGLLGGALTQTPGSSAWYRGGLIVYADELKCRLAGVSRRTLETHGAVSEPVARELAAGARDRCGADIGIGVTGVAGPGGGTPAKPVGLVHVAFQDGRQSVHWELRLVGDRSAVRHRTVTTALDRLRRRLLEGT